MVPIFATCALKPECGFKGQRSSAAAAQMLEGIGRVELGESVSP